MPLYTDFQLGADTPPPEKLIPLEQPNIPESPSAQLQTAHAQGGKIDFSGQLQTFPYDLQEFTMPGFKALDDAMRRYWSGIRVPTKDSYRFLRIKIAGQDKSLMIWNDELKGGRVRLPVAALDRTAHEFNPDKFSPATKPMAIRYPTKRGDRVIKVFRPVPFLVEYKLSIWAERKRDIENIMYQVLTRYNPLAEFKMFDGHLVGVVQLRFGGANDVSDKEVGHDQHANIRYEVSTTAEAWLPLPEVSCPTVLGRVTMLQERSGMVLEANRGGNLWSTPDTGV